MTFAIALILTALGALSRLAPHPPNMLLVGAGGLALFAGARLPRYWAFAVPLMMMIGTDMLLDRGTTYSPLQGDYLARYAAFALIVALGTWLKASNNGLKIVGFSVASSILFFLISNFGVWAFPNAAHPPTYTRDFTGLLNCYAAGLAFYSQDPFSNFFLNSVVSDLMGVGILFGLDAAVARAFARPKPAPIHLTES